MPNGIVIIDKPQGWTSMDVCAKLRGILHEKRVGHAGTLDPMATGVLPVFVGQATKAVSFAEGGQKVYEAVLQLGLVTDTQDTTGETLEKRAVTVTEDEVRAALPRFLGEIEQIPPMYSAIKVNGQKLYDLARQGREVARKPRMITIFDLALTQNLGNGQYALRIVCSKGTYIRTLCHDLGQALGCGGCMAALRRTEASNFRIDEAVTLEDVQREGEALLRPTDSLFPAVSGLHHPERRAGAQVPLRQSPARKAPQWAVPRLRARRGVPCPVGGEGRHAHLETKFFQRVTLTQKGNRNYE